MSCVTLSVRPFWDTNQIPRGSAFEKSLITFMPLLFTVIYFKNSRPILYLHNFCHIGRVWIQLFCVCVCVFVFFFFFFSSAVVFDFSAYSLYTFHRTQYCSQQNKPWNAHQWVLFTVHGPTNSTFQQLFH